MQFSAPRGPQRAPGPSKNDSEMQNRSRVKGRDSRGPRAEKIRASHVWEGVLRESRFRPPGALDGPRGRQKTTPGRKTGPGEGVGGGTPRGPPRRRGVATVTTRAMINCASAVLDINSFLPRRLPISRLQGLARPLFHRENGMGSVGAPREPARPTQNSGAVLLSVPEALRHVRPPRAAGPSRCGPGRRAGPGEGAGTPGGRAPGKSGRRHVWGTEWNG